MAPVSNRNVEGPTSRTTIAKNLQPIVDSSLKDLRNVSQRITAFLTPFAEELQVLERLYYKGKNQHSLALFWRKVPEMRRFGRRIASLPLSEGIEALRYAFYSEEEKPSPKLLRGSWTQLPSHNLLVSALNWLKLVSHLLEQGRARFFKAYETFSSHLGSGTFMTLVLLLTAILARLDFLISELQNTLALYWDALSCVMNEIVDPTRKQLQNPFKPPNPNSGNVVIASSSARVTVQPAVFTDVTAMMDVDEDLGSRIISKPSMISAAPPLSRKEEAALVSFIIDEEVPPPVLESSTSARPSQGVLRDSIPVTAEQNPPILTTKKKKKQKVQPEADNVPKRDEIDDIFGF